MVVLSRNHERLLMSLDTFQNPNTLKRSNNKQTEYLGMLNQSVIQISDLRTLLLGTEALVISWQFANCISICTMFQYRISLHCRDRIDLWGWSCPYLTIYSTLCWYLYILMNMIILLVSTNQTEASMLIDYILLGTILYTCSICTVLLSYGILFI